MWDNCVFQAYIFYPGTFTIMAQMGLIQPCFQTEFMFIHEQQKPEYL